MEQKTHWKKRFNYEHLGAHDLPGGKDIVLTIQRIDSKEVANRNGEKGICTVCYLNEVSKPMILNRTNCKTLTKLSGSPHLEDWPGLRIQVGAARIKAFGEVTDSLCIRPFAPKPVNEKPTVQTGSAQWNTIVDSLRKGLDYALVEQKYSLTAQQIKSLKNEIART